MRLRNRFSIGTDFVRKPEDLSFHPTGTNIKQ